MHKTEVIAKLAAWINQAPRGVRRAARQERYRRALFELGVNNVALMTKQESEKMAAWLEVQKG